MHPKVKESKMVGKYNPLASSGGGLVWDAVLEYRVWCHTNDGDDYYYAFETYEEALDCASHEPEAEMPLALVLQQEHINEPEPGRYIHVKEQRITEWPIEFLKNPQRTENTIPDFMSRNAPGNRLDILRGLA